MKPSGMLRRKKRGCWMLAKIVFVLTEEYRNYVQNNLLYEKVQNDLYKHGADVEWCGLDFFFLEKEKGDFLQKADCLFLTDDKTVIERLNEKGCFVIALYHEGVSGILSGTQYAMEGIEDIDWEYLIKVYQRYCQIPWHITETRRCMIREMNAADVDDLYELYKDKEVTQYTEDLFGDKEQETQYILDYIENIYKYYGFGTWLIHRKEDGKLIGRAGFNYRPGFEEVELGFIIGFPYWRNGYAYEVCRHLLRIGKEVYEFERVQALVDKRNAASVSLLKKLGFIYVEDSLLEGQKFERYLYE